MKEKKILMITSRGFQDDFRVLKSIYNISKITKNFSIAQLLKPNDPILKNKTIFKDLKIFSIKPINYRKISFYKKNIMKFMKILKNE